MMYEKEVPLETGDAEDHFDEDKLDKESSINYMDSDISFATKVCSGTFAVANVSFDNSSQVLEVSMTRCAMTPLLVDNGLEAATPFDLNHASCSQTLHKRLDRVRPSVVLFSLLGGTTKGVFHRDR